MIFESLMGHERQYIVLSSVVAIVVNEEVQGRVKVFCLGVEKPFFINLDELPEMLDKIKEIHEIPKREKRTFIVETADGGTKISAIEGR